MDQHLTIVDHPLVQHKLTLMRDTATSTAMFRQLLCEISQLLAYEVTRNLLMSTRQIETPLMTMDAPVIDRNGSQLNLILAGPFRMLHSCVTPWIVPVMRVLRMLM